MAAYLASWRAIRRARLWRQDAKDLPHEERIELVEDCIVQIDQLTKLENLLAALASPVCQLPLQAIQADRSRIEIAVERLNGGKDV
jgi:hypothetical protein